MRKQAEAIGASAYEYELSSRSKKAADSKASRTLVVMTQGHDVAAIC